MLKGITAHPIKLKKRVRNGANKKRNLLALFGKMTSLTISFKASAKGCKIPHMPVILGPFRRCIEPRTRRSAKVKKATEIIKKINVTKDKYKKIQLLL